MKTCFLFFFKFSLYYTENFLLFSSFEYIYFNMNEIDLVYPVLRICYIMYTIFLYLCFSLCPEHVWLRWKSCDHFGSVSSGAGVSRMQSCSPESFQKTYILNFFKLLKHSRGETLFILFILLCSYSKAVLLPLVLLFPLSPKKDTSAPTTPAFRAQPEALCALSITLHCFCTHFKLYL